VPAAATSFPTRPWPIGRLPLSRPPVSAVRVSTVAVSRRRCWFTRRMSPRRSVARGGFGIRADFGDADWPAIRPYLRPDRPPSRRGRVIPASQPVGDRTFDRDGHAPGPWLGCRPSRLEEQSGHEREDQGDGDPERAASTAAGVHREQPEKSASSQAGSAGARPMRHSRGQWRHGRHRDPSRGRTSSTGQRRRAWLPTTLTGGRASPLSPSFTVRRRRPPPGSAHAHVRQR
jgi:hypothetical protein